MKCEYVIIESFMCKECGLEFMDGDIISVRKSGKNIVHDCDNCLAALELEIGKDIK